MLHDEGVELGPVVGLCDLLGLAVRSIGLLAHVPLNKPSVD